MKYIRKKRYKESKEHEEQEKPSEEHKEGRDQGLTIELILMNISILISVDNTGECRFG